MFDKLKGMAAQMAMMQKLMKDENFRAFISNPKVQDMMRDPDFQDAVKKQDSSRLMNNPKFAALKNDPELSALLVKVDLLKSLRPPGA